MKPAILILFLLFLNYTYSQNLLRNGDFESFSSCPTSQNGSAAVGLPIPFLNDWFNTNAATADYCNRCGFQSQPVAGFDPPGTDPTTNAGAGGYLGIINSTNTSEQAGQCLTSTIISGSSCTFIFNVSSAVPFINTDFTTPPAPEPVQIGIWGMNTCGTIDYSGTNCPTTASKTLLAVSTAIPVTRGGFWISDTITFTAPFDINEISVGGNCKSTGSASTIPQNYYYIDELILTAIPPNPCAGCPSGGSGSTWTWTGCQDTDWFNACNWDRGSVPTSTSNVIIPGGTPREPTISSGAANCFNIEIRSSLGAEVTINSSGGAVLNIFN